MHMYLISSHSNSFKNKFIHFLKKVEKKTAVSHYIYARKKY
jgi:hypothetical protein